MGCAQSTEESRVINQYITLKKPSQVIKIFFQPVNFIWMDPTPIQAKKIFIDLHQIYSLSHVKTLNQIVSVIVSQPKKFFRVILSGPIQEQDCKTLQQISNVIHIYLYTAASLYSPTKKSSMIVKDQQIIQYEGLKNDYPKIKFIAQTQEDFLNKLGEYYKINNVNKEGCRFISVNKDKNMVNKHEVNLLIFLNLIDKKRAKQDFIKLATLLYKSQKQIDLKLFLDSYPVDPPIETILSWFLRNTFYSKLLNGLMKLTYDLGELGYIRLPFHDMFTSIKILYKKQRRQKFQVYKSLRLNLQQLQLLKQNQGKPIQILQFMTFTKSKTDAYRDMTTDPDINVQLILKISKQRSQQNDYGYTDVSSLSVVGQEQILFNALNVFLVKKIQKPNKKENIESKNTSNKQKNKQTSSPAPHITKIVLQYGVPTANSIAKKIAQQNLQQYRKNVKKVGDLYLLKNYVEFNQKTTIKYNYIWFDSINQQKQTGYYKRFNQKQPAIFCKNIQQIKNILNHNSQKFYCIITTVQYAEETCTNFETNKNVVYVYIFCHDILLKGESLKYRYTKIKAVVNTLQNLYQLIIHQPRRENRNTIPNFCRVNANNKLQIAKNKYSLYSILLMKNRKKAKQDFVALASSVYPDEKNLIEKFIKQYSTQTIPRPQDVIAWYSKNTFFFKLINTFSRSPNPMETSYIRLPFMDVFNSINSLYKKQKLYQFQVYKGGKLDLQEIKLMKENQGKLIELLGFMSTHRNIKTAQKYAVNFMFVIKIPAEGAFGKRSRFVDFGYIDTVKLNRFDIQEEVLINAFNVFRVEKIQQYNGFYTITLKYGQLANLFQRYKNIMKPHGFSKKLASSKISSPSKSTTSKFILQNQPLSQTQLTQINQYRIQRKRIKRLLKNQGDSLFLCQNFRQAITFNQLYMEMHKQNHLQNTKQVAKIYNQLGLCYKQVRQVDKALDSFLKSSIIFESTVGQNHSFTATSYSNIGNMYKWKKQYDKALDFYMRALKIRINTFGKQHALTASSYGDIGSIYYLKKQYQKALEFNLQGLLIQINVLGQNHVETAQTYNDIGMIYQRKGEHSKAMKYLQDALKIRLDYLGKGNYLVAQTYGNIAQVYKNQGDSEKALQFYIKSLKINKNVRGNVSQQVATTYNDIGLIYRQKGQLDEALQYLLQSLKLYKGSVGRLHTCTATVYNNIGQIYRSKQLLDTALQYFNNSLKIFIKVCGQQSSFTATVYNNIASVHYSQGEIQKCEQQYRKALQIRLRILGQFHQQTAQTYNNLGEVYRFTKQHVKAEQCYKQSLQIKLHILTQYHISTAITYYNLGLLYKQTKKQYQAFENFEKCYQIRVKLLGEGHKDTLTAYNSMKEYINKKLIIKQI